MQETGIAWTGWTWNPMSGCKAVSSECAHCYAETLAEDKRGTAAFPHGFELTVRPHKLTEPARRKAPSLIFVNSMSDLGLDEEELATDEKRRLLESGFTLDSYRDKIFDAIEATPRHRYQILTKRPARLLTWLRARGRRVPESVWMGVTVGDDHPKCLHRLEVLRRFRDFGARVLFVSAEPLLCHLSLPLRGIDWIIVGGESGRHASDPKLLEQRFLVHRVPGERTGSYGWAPRPDRIDWVRPLRDDADYCGVPFFFKQWGGPRPTSAGRLLDGRTHDAFPTVPGALPEGFKLPGSLVEHVHLPLVESSRGAS